MCSPHTNLQFTLWNEFGIWVSFAQQRSQLLLYMYNVQCMVNLKKPLWQVKRRENTVDVSVWVYHSIHVHDACLSWIFTQFDVFGNFRLNEKQAKQEWDKNRTTKPNNRHTNIELLNAFGMICGKFCCCFERCKLKKNPSKFHLNGVLHVRTDVISFGWYEYYVCLFGELLSEFANSMHHHNQSCFQMNIFQW